MSELVPLGKRAAAAPARDGAEVLALPHTVELPTRYYGRIALADTAARFAEVAEVESRAGDGVFVVTFHRVAEGCHAGEVVAEFLNHALYASASSGPEVES